MTDQNQRNYNNLDIFKEHMSIDLLLQDFCQAMSSKELQENIEYIAQMRDIEIEEDSQ